MKNVIILGIIALLIVLMGSYLPREILGVVAIMQVPDTTVFVNTEWQAIDASFNNIFLGGFQFVADPAIEYIHDEKHYFRSEANTSFSCSTPSVTAWIGLRRNGTLVDSAATFCKNQDQVYNLYDFSLALVEPNDKLQLVHRVETPCTLIRTNYKTATLRAD